MLSPPLPTRLPGYDLSAPAEADAVAALGRVFGAERAAQRWADACAAAGLAPGRVRTPAQLEQACRALAGQGGPAAAVARSLEIRTRTYHRLAGKAAATTAGGQG